MENHKLIQTITFHRKFFHMKIIAWTIFSYECNHLHFRRRTSLLCRIERILNKFSTSLQSDLITITITLVIVIDAVVIVTTIAAAYSLLNYSNITLIRARDENLYFVIALVLIYTVSFTNNNDLY